jgi:hypothetical protein
MPFQLSLENASGGLGRGLPGPAGRTAIRLSGELVTGFFDRDAESGVARQGLAGDADPACRRVRLVSSD